MKVSGSHMETIESASQNLFRMKEEQTIKAVTAKLSSEGKHVINIIHGTPSSLMGTVSKTITFLWEGDDEEIKRMRIRKKKNEMRAKQRREEMEKKEHEKRLLHARIGSYKDKAKELEERIAYATAEEAVTENDLIQKEKNASGASGVWPGILLLVFGVGFIASLNFFGVIFGLLACLFGGLLVYIGINDYKKIHNNSQTRKEIIKRIDEDKENIDELKEMLEKEKEKISELEKEYNNM